MAMHGINPRTKEASNLIGDNHFDHGSLTVTTTAGEEDKDINKAIALFDESDDFEVSGFAIAKAFRTSLSELEYKNGSRQISRIRMGK